MGISRSDKWESQYEKYEDQKTPDYFLKFYVQNII